MHGYFMIKWKKLLKNTLIKIVKIIKTKDKSVAMIRNHLVSLNTELFEFISILRIF